MPELGGLQLLPETRKKIDVKIPGENRLLVLSLVFLGIILAVYGGLRLYTRSILSAAIDYDIKLRAIEKNRDKAAESKILALNNQMALVAPMMANHLIWSDAMVKTQNLVLPSVKFDFMDADAVGNKFTIKALAPNYTTVAKQIAAFYQNEAITDITINKLTSMPIGKIEFILQLNFDINKLLIKATPKATKK